MFAHANGAVSGNFRSTYFNLPALYTPSHNYLSANKGLLYSKELALEHDFNTVIGKLIRVCGVEIPSDKCKK